MNKLSLNLRIWFLSSVAIGIEFLILLLFKQNFDDVIFTAFAFVASLLFSIPAMIIFSIVLPIIKKLSFFQNKLLYTFLLTLGISFFYGFLAVLIDTSLLWKYANSLLFEAFQTFLTFSAAVFFCGCFAILLSLKQLNFYFYPKFINNVNDSWQPDNQSQINIYMETTHQQSFENSNQTVIKHSNRILVKATIIAVLTICMLIPTTIISNLVIERQTTYNEQIKTGTRLVSTESTLFSQNYEKTMRTTKYAILVIGLTFAVFFLIELMHKKPVHPVQYTLVGLALAIFYTLLLSIGEYILFNYAYLISAVATILLISFYVNSHFKNWKAASGLSGVLAGLYGFILVLISLEHTALLVGSIGLFIVLAIVMYTTRNINWYNPDFGRPEISK